MFRAPNSPIFRRIFFDRIYSFWYNAPKLLPTGATVEMELFNSALHVSGAKFAHLQAHFF